MFLLTLQTGVLRQLSHLAIALGYTALTYHSPLPTCQSFSWKGQSRTNLCFASLPCFDIHHFKLSSAYMRYPWSSLDQNDHRINHFCLSHMDSSLLWLWSNHNTHCKSVGRTIYFNLTRIRGSKCALAKFH